MYKFLICQTVDDNQEKWYLSFNSKMYPDFSSSVKEAALLGYWSQKQNKWITSGRAIQLRSNYANVKRAMDEGELTLVMLSHTIDELKSAPYQPYKGKDMFNSLYYSGVVEL